MKQIFDALASLKTQISNLLHYEAINSYNKTENNFYGPVNFIGKQSKKINGMAGPYPTNGKENKKKLN